MPHIISLLTLMLVRMWCEGSTLGVASGDIEQVIIDFLKMIKLHLVDDFLQNNLMMTSSV